MKRIELLIVVLLQLKVFAGTAQHVRFIAVDSDSGLVTLLASESHDPFSREAQIRFRLADSMHVDVLIVAFTGETVRHLLSSDLKAGIHKLTWDGKDNGGQPVSSGVFIYKIQTSQITRSAPLAFLY